MNKKNSNQNINLANQKFNSSSISESGYPSNNALLNGVRSQEQFVLNNSNFDPRSQFSNNGNLSSKLENLKDWSNSNINSNFKEHDPELYMLDTEYKHNTLYDNLNKNLLKETITEIRINIDSIDRDIELYPDPFFYVVNFGPIVNSGINTGINGRSNIKNELKQNNKKKIQNNNCIDEIKQPSYLFESPSLIIDYTTKLERNTNPFIIRNFDNIKFIKLDSGVIPRFNSIKINCEWDYCREHKHKQSFIRDDYDRVKDYTILNQRYIPDDTNTYSPLGDRFIQIYIKEIDNNNNFGTNTITNKSFILIADKLLGVLYFKCIPYSAIQTYKDSLLGEINKLTIQFYNSWGKPLVLNTSLINYETTQIKMTDIINPLQYDIDKIIQCGKSFAWFKDKITQILKCFIIINYDIKSKIPFYCINNSIEIDINSLNNSCIKYLKLEINQNDFIINNIFDELDEFVSDTGFVNALKKTVSGKLIKISIDDYLLNIIWFNNQPQYLTNQILNLKVLDTNYELFGFKILDKLQTEILNIGSNHAYQNYLTFVMGVYTNELNTKIDFNK